MYFFFFFFWLGSSHPASFFLGSSQSSSSRGLKPGLLPQVHRVHGKGHSPMSWNRTQGRPNPKHLPGAAQPSFPRCGRFQGEATPGGYRPGHLDLRNGRAPHSHLRTPAWWFWGNLSNFVVDTSAPPAQPPVADGRKVPC